MPSNPNLPARRAQSLILNRRRALGLMGGAAALSLPFAPLVQAKAPLLGRQNTSFYRFMLGKFEVTIVRDGAAILSGPYPTFGADQFEEDVHELLTANHVPLKKFELPYAPVVINTGNELVLFDSGNGSTRRPDSGHLVEGLKLAGYTPEQIDVVIITHCHPDHIGGLTESGTPVFPNARYVCGEVEYDFWSPKELLDADAGLARRARSMQENVVPLAEKMSFLKDEGEALPGIRAIASPGHTPGHLAYHVESEGQRLMIWGDAIVHYVISVQRPEWPLAADMDKDVAGRSRRKLLEMAAADKIAVTGYHLPFPALGFVEPYEDAFRFVPAGYQFNL
ncbi:MAG: MBL fold metallo-hydrolase [Alphaproteobacteria bacterium]|nr:MBL fold metallo-hydrolase [Alphaproteobacteria bacterium]